MKFYKTTLTIFEDGASKSTITNGSLGGQSITNVYIRRSEEPLMEDVTRFNNFFQQTWNKIHEEERKKIEQDHLNNQQNLQKNQQIASLARTEQEFMNEIISNQESQLQASRNQETQLQASRNQSPPIECLKEFRTRIGKFSRKKPLHERYLKYEETPIYWPPPPPSPNKTESIEEIISSTHIPTTPNNWPISRSLSTGLNTLSTITQRKEQQTTLTTGTNQLLEEKERTKYLKTPKPRRKITPSPQLERIDEI